MSKVRVELTNHGTGRIWINDQEIHDVTKILLVAGVNRRNRVRVEIIARELSVTSARNDVGKVVHMPELADARKDN